MSSEQVMSIHAYYGQITHPQSNLDGAEFVVTAWKPSPEELKTLNEGGPVYLSCLGGLPAHFLTSSFFQATYGQHKD